MVQILVTLCVVVSMAASANAQAPSYRLVEIARIGELESDQDEYIFGRPSSAAIDGDNNLYIADASRNAILVYDPSGRYLRTIGARGDAPGEFNEITAISLRDSSLVVLDRLRQRVTYFSLEGQLQNTTVLDHKYQVWPSKVLQLNSQSYLIVAPKMTSEFEPLADLGLVHLYDSGFEKSTATLANADQFYDIHNDYSNTRIIMGGDLNVYVNANGGVIVVKYGFDSIYYYYRLEKEEWKLSQYEGKGVGSQAYKLVKVDKAALATGRTNSRVTRIMNGPRGFFAVDELRKSFLLVGNEDASKIVHVYGDRSDSKNWSYRCELLTVTNGHVESCDFKVDYLDGESSEYNYRLNVIGSGTNGQYVFADNVEGYPVVRVMTLQEM